MPAMTTELYKPTTSKTQVESRGCLSNSYQCCFWNVNIFTTKSSTHELLCNSLFMANWTKDSVHVPDMKKKNLPQNKARQVSNWIPLELIRYILYWYIVSNKKKRKKAKKKKTNQKNPKPPTNILLEPQQHWFLQVQVFSLLLFTIFSQNNEVYAQKYSV